MFDLSLLAAKEYAVVDIVHPVSKKPLGFSFTIAGPASEEYLATRRQLSKARMDDDSAMNPEKAEVYSLDLLVGAVTGWTPFVYEEAVLPFSKDNVRKILSNPKYHWLKEQVDSAIVSIGNFIGA